MSQTSGSTQKHQIKKIITRHVGIALVIAFVLVTAMFIVLFINSEQRQRQEFGEVNTTGESTGISGEGESGDSQNSSSDQSGQDPDGIDDPENPNSSASTDDHSDPYDLTNPDDPADQSDRQTSDDTHTNTDPQGDSDQTQTGDQTEPAEPVRVAYLTFDDGPIRDITPGILDILLEEEISATFFVLPYQGVDDLYQRIIDEGHEIGNHSYSHVYERLYERDVSRFRDDILRARNFIYDNFEYTTTSFRFPGGQQRAGNGLNARLEVIRDFGYRHFHWHVDPDDWRVGRTAAEVRASVKEQASNHIRNGREHVIILMHDRYQRTLDALPGIIRDLRELGFEFDIVRNMP